MTNSHKGIEHDYIKYNPKVLIFAVQNSACKSLKNYKYLTIDVRLKALQTPSNIQLYKVMGMPRLSVRLRPLSQQRLNNVCPLRESPRRIRIIKGNTIDKKVWRTNHDP